ncbi:MAG: carbohydrate-binding family 9-like protein [Phycisphaerales bacterium]|nr:carbohydrate-binding family 9-like protein [Phycisphaerales bacterium]
MITPLRIRSLVGGLLLLVPLWVTACASPPPSIANPTTVVEHPPLEYTCHQTPSPPEFDGDLDAGVWQRADWTGDFRDIEGSSRPDPRFQTRVKMLWDETHLYVGCAMEEPGLWATYDQRDMIVFHEHDFEVFIDPDGDGNEYYEIEINVLGTIFDLFLHRPYRLGGPAEHGWDASGLKFAIHADGTINDPDDEDRGWTVELAIPFSDLRPPSTRADGTPWSLPPITEHRRASVPQIGETWRINFSRVEWDLEVVDGRYRKIEGRPEYNWTWTPQWEINMHVPEWWGMLRFVAE